jgi:hypothetical protein
MAVVPVVVFRGVRASAGLRREIERLAQNLEKFYAPITRCDVAVEWSQRRHQSGNRYRVRIDVVVPGGIIAVSHCASNHADLQEAPLVHIQKGLEVTTGPASCAVAIREAFATARRRLQDFARRQRGSVKRHRASRAARQTPATETAQYKAPAVRRRVAPAL